MSQKHKQSGASLIVSMIMLLVLTLLVVSAIRSSNTNLRIAGNMQAQAEAAAAAQQAIEQVLSSPNIFITPVAQTIPVGTLSVMVAAPNCIMSKPVEMQESADAGGNKQDTGDDTTGTGTGSGSGAGTGGAALGYVDTYWDVPATVTDPATGASVEHHQGVRIRLPANPNPCI